MIETARGASGARVGAADVAAAAQLACLLEASAPKPGNVSPARPFDDLRYEDFLASAAAIGGPLAAAGTRPLGDAVRLAIAATARWSRSNANLGIVLLLAPIARAAFLHPRSAMPSGGRSVNDELRDAVRRVLDATTIDDAREVYAAIRLAVPGGLGRVADQDVAHEPTVTLIEAMRLAADRDAVAREYANGFELTFGVGVPALAAQAGGSRARGGGLGGRRLLVAAGRAFPGEGLDDLADDGGLDGRRCRPDELSLALQMCEQCLALDSELFGELVDPDLSHISPVPGPA